MPDFWLWSVAVFWGLVFREWWTPDFLSDCHGDAGVIVSVVSNPVCGAERGFSRDIVQDGEI